MNLNELWVNGTPLEVAQELFPDMKVGDRARWVSYDRAENDILWEKLLAETKGLKQITLPLEIRPSSDDRPLEQGVGTAIVLMPDLGLRFRPNGSLAEVVAGYLNVLNPCLPFDWFSGVVGPEDGEPTVQTAINSDSSCQIVAFENVRIFLYWRDSSASDKFALPDERLLYQVSVCRL